jgi:hypothetical protein
MTAAHLEDFNHHFLIVTDVDSLKHLAVFTPAQLTHQLVVVLITGERRTRQS